MTAMTAGFFTVSESNRLMGVTVICVICVIRACNPLQDKAFQNDATMTLTMTDASSASLNDGK